MTKRTTIIGQTGFMAQSLQEYGLGKHWTWLSHKDALEDQSWLDHTDVLINFAYAPALRREPYDPAVDIDSTLARLIASRAVHYVMLSSRMVYGHPQNSDVLSEDMEPEPLNIYGQNKLKIERALREILPHDRLTILRLSNIFGFEPGRPSFFGMALSRLAEEGRIVYDMNPFVARDFLSCWRFGAALEEIAATPVPGLYNLGAGFGIETGLIAEWLIDGFGSGELLITNMERRDAFHVTMDKFYKAFPAANVMTLHDLEQDCRQCGTRLKTWKIPEKGTRHG